MARVIQPSGIVVVEGSDAVGKTTLIKNALSTWAKGGVYLHCTYKHTTEAIERHQTRMFVIAVRRLLEGKWVFMDRWWPSDAVYSPAFNRQRISTELTWLFHQLLISTQAGGYVFCYDALWEDTVARHAKMLTIRPEKFSNISDVAKHYTQFATVRRPIGHLYYQSEADPRVQTIQPFAHIAETATFERKCWGMRANHNGFEVLARSLPKHFNINERRHI